MLQLIPIRVFLTILLLLGGLPVIAASYLGLIGSGGALVDAMAVIRWSTPIAILLMGLACALWRWVPFLQRLTFPYLGGEWSGKLEFHGDHGSGIREVKLVVRHSPFHIKLILDSDESTSRTLVTRVEHDSGIERDRLYYVYLNERKEGVAGAGQSYRGLAVMRVTANAQELSGNYFAEQKKAGTLSVTRDKQSPWWMVWR